MSSRSTEQTKSRDLASYILPVSSTMIGVCATLIGLVKVVEVRSGPSHVDEYASIVGIMFLVSALSSYLSIRYSHRAAISIRIEQFADAVFLCGLLGITLVATLFAYEVI